MLAVTAASINPTTRWPAWWWGSGRPTARRRRVSVSVRSRFANHHYLWTLKGVGIAESASDVLAAMRRVSTTT